MPIPNYLQGEKEDIVNNKMQIHDFPDKAGNFIPNIDIESGILLST